MKMKDPFQIVRLHGVGDGKHKAWELELWAEFESAESENKLTMACKGLGSVTGHWDSSWKLSTYRFSLINPEHSGKSEGRALFLPDDEGQLNVYEKALHVGLMLSFCHKGIDDGPVIFRIDSVRGYRPMGRKAVATPTNLKAAAPPKRRRARAS